jgi:Tfp pilus assembly protein PilE
MMEVRTAITWLRARMIEKASQRDERGFTAIEWLLIALGIIVIAGIAITAVRTYVTNRTNELNGP